MRPDRRFSWHARRGRHALPGGSVADGCPRHETAGRPRL